MPFSCVNIKPHSCNLVRLQTFKSVPVSATPGFKVFVEATPVNHVFIRNIKYKYTSCSYHLQEFRQVTISIIIPYTTIVQ